MQSKVPPYAQATLWFEELYKRNANNNAGIPWARLEVNPLLGEYLESQAKNKGKALVIGCGLGDDARALELAGYDVVAIDISKSALESATKRFSPSAILFEKQDIFEMPSKYENYFDFVFEAFTIQSLPIEFRKKMIQAISNTLAKNAKLFVVAHKKERDFQGPPWPLRDEEIELFKSCDLEELHFEICDENSHISSKKYKVMYQKN